MSQAIPADQCTPYRLPMSFEKARLVNVDFDGTAFNTGEQGPGIYDVNQAYQLALDQHLGKGAVELFIAQSGHNHRTPAEIVHDLSPDMSEHELATYASLVTQTKLEVLLGQIGTPINGGRWPRPIPGFSDAWNSIYGARKRGFLVDSAVISAGHTPFIEKTFNVHGMPHPDIMVTDDVLNEYGLNTLPPEHRAKPAALPLTISRMLWATLYKRSIHESGLADAMKARIIHVGDSLEKDGGIAANCGVEFVHITADSSVEDWHEVELWAGVTSDQVQEAINSGAA